MLACMSYPQNPDPERGPVNAISALVSSPLGTSGEIVFSKSPAITSDPLSAARATIKGIADQKPIEVAQEEALQAIQPK